MSRNALLALLLSELAFVAPSNPRRDFLFSRGWVPLGAEAGTGVEGWGKLIDHKAVTISEPEALKLEGYGLDGPELGGGV